MQHHNNYLSEYHFLGAFLWLIFWLEMQQQNQIMIRFNIPFCGLYFLVRNAAAKYSNLRFKKIEFFQITTKKKLDFG
jgi:hypothetical protein